jgi:hypothetical protein
MYTREKQQTRSRRRKESTKIYKVKDNEKDVNRNPLKERSKKKKKKEEC